MLEIKNWMSKPVISVRPDDLLDLATKKMVDYNIGDVVVVDKQKKPVGILTERDILKRVVIRRQNIDALKVRDVMTNKLVTVPVTSTFLEISRLMKKGKLRRIPITQHGKLVGIITARDLIKVMSI